jgi:hypothetical protein
VSSIEVNLPDDWRPWQAEQWSQLKRFNVLVVHRRAGKTVLCIMWLIARLLEAGNRVGAYVGPQAKQLRMNIWPLWKRLASQVPGASFNETELRTDFPNGSRCYVLGTENAHSIRGAGLDAAVLDEVAQIGPMAWGEVIRPALADRQGQAIMIGTPLGMGNLFYQLYERAGELPDWHRCLLTVQDTNVLPDSEIDSLKREMTEEEYAQEFLCDWSAAVRGAYFGKAMAEAEKAGRITSVPHDPLLKVHTSWDLGINDLTTIWCWQVTGSQVRAIDLLAFQNTGLPDIIARLRQKPYAWGEHYVPHDAKVRELGSGKSRQEIALGLGLNWTVVPEVGLMSGIDSARALIPRVWFDREKVKDGIEALKTYRTEYDDIRRVYSLKPLHSWESHYADAFRYFAVGRQGQTSDRKPIDYSHLDRAVI